MSILVVQVAPEGILFAADRNVTSQTKLHDGKTLIFVSGQTQRPKVLKWPNHEVIVGYVGAARVQGVSMDNWLYRFIGRNLEFHSLDSLSEALTRELDALFHAHDFDGPLIIHLAGFERVKEQWTPRVHFIRNTTAITDEGAYVVDDHFERSEELQREIYFGGRTGDEIKQRLGTEHTYWGFQQGTDLAAFNTIRDKLLEAIVTLIEVHPKKIHPRPNTLEERSKHLNFFVRAYGAYFASFYRPFEQYVGGGADVVYAAWPEN